MNCGDSGPCARLGAEKEAVSVDCVNLKCCVYTELDQGNIPDSGHVVAQLRNPLFWSVGKLNC